MKWKKILLLLICVCPLGYASEAFYSSKEHSVHLYVKGGAFTIIPTVGLGVLFESENHHGLDFSANTAILVNSLKGLYQHPISSNGRWYAGAGLGANWVTGMFNNRRWDYAGISIEQKIGYQWVGQRGFLHFFQLELSEGEFIDWYPIPTLTLGVGF